jgi:hypothetical protein
VSEFAWNCSFRRIATRAPSGRNIRVGPGVEFEAVEGDAAAADGHFSQPGSNLGVEAIAIDAQVARRGVMADQSGEHAPSSWSSSSASAVSLLAAAVRDEPM